MSETEIIVAKGAVYAQHRYYRQPCIIAFDWARPYRFRRWIVCCYTARCIRRWWRGVMRDLAEGNY